MKKIKINFASCVLTSNSLSSCTKCQDICPKDVIKIDEEGLKLTPHLCIECAACFGVCPTESFDFENFSIKDFCFGFLDDKESLISCKKNIPCLSALNSEYLISFALEKKENIFVDIGHCESCEIKEKVFAHIEKSVKEANNFLKWFGIEHQVMDKKVSFTQEEKKTEKNLSRRELFSRVNLKDIVKTKLIFDEKVNEDEFKTYTVNDAKFDKELIKQKKRPFKREFFINATRNLPDFNPQKTEIEKSAFGFISSKKISKECTNCAVCYQVCPSGALNGDRAKGKIEFDFLYCLSCASCYDACPLKCISNEESLKKEDFTSPKRKSLASFFMRNCHECGVLYVNNGSSLCPRCQEMDNEARELVGF